MDLPDKDIVGMPVLGSLACAPRIRGVWLDDNKLRSLPSAMFHGTGIEAVRLAKNQLQSLPAALFHGTSVETVGLEGNQLRSLPATLFDGTSVKEVYLDGNNLESLPPTLFRRTNVTQAVLSDNHFDPPLKFDCCSSDPEFLENCESQSDCPCKSIAPSCASLLGDATESAEARSCTSNNFVEAELAALKLAHDSGELDDAGFIAKAKLLVE